MQGLHLDIDILISNDIVKRHWKIGFRQPSLAHPMLIQQLCESTDVDMRVFTMDYSVDIHLQFHLPHTKLTFIAPPLILPKMEKTNTSSTGSQLRYRPRSGTHCFSRVRQNPLGVWQSTELKPWELVGQRQDQVEARLIVIENNQIEMHWPYQTV